MAIHFHSGKTPGFKLKNVPQVKKWINSVIAGCGFRTGIINYIFLSDEELLKINLDYLNHDYYTDIISFDYSSDKVISGDIFISVERVLDNARFYNSTSDTELLRVMIHGVLHFLGIRDGSNEEKEMMRAKENLYLDNVKDLLIIS